MRIPEIATTLLLLNSKRGPLADEAVRSRFVEAFDVDQFIRRVEGPAVVPARGLIPPGLLGYEAQGVLEPRTLYDVATGPVELTVTMTPPLKTAWGEEFVRWLGERGFRAKIVNETYAEHEAAVAEGRVDVVATGYNFDYPDADSIIYGALHSSGRYGGNFVASAEIDRLCEAGRAETDPASRHAIYHEVEEIVARTARAIPLYHSRRWCFVRPEIEGVALNLFQPYLSYEKLFIRE
jgi:ABC-type transport system substrate-binding protein